jgi:hypothetical protein
MFKLMFKKLSKGNQPETVPSASKQWNQISIDTSELGKAGITAELLKEKLEAKFQVKLQSGVYWRNQIQYNVDRNVTETLEL